MATESHSLTGAAGAEEIAEKCGTFGGAHTAINFKPVIKASVTPNVEDRAEGSGLGVASTIDDAGDPCMDDSADTHQTRLKRDV